MSVPPEQMGFLGRLGGAVTGGLGKLGGALFPTDPSLDPQMAAQLQRNALVQLGLGTLAGAQQPGGTLGGALFGGLQQAQQGIAGAQQQAFQSRRLKAQDDRESRIEKQEGDRIKLAKAEADRKQREQGATVAQRFATGLEKYKADPLGYYNIVSRDPEFQATAKQYGLDPATITTPEQVLELGKQLGALGGVGAAAAQREPSEPLEVVQKDGKVVLVPRSQAAGLTPYQRPSNALSVQLADGTVITDGPPGAVGANELTKPTVNKLQETIVNAQDKLDRVNTIAQTYKPEFLQARGFIKAGTTRLVDFLGGDVPEQDRKFLSEYSEFRANAARDLNATVKELNGSAVTPGEIKRTLKAEPSDTDSPIEFESKILAQTKFIKRAILRANYALKNGIGTKSVDELSKLIPLEAVDAIYEARANQILDELGGTDDKRAEAIRRANQEFGLAR